MRRLKTVRRPPIYPKTPGHLPYSLTHPLPLSSRRPSVSFGGFGLRRRNVVLLADSFFESGVTPIIDEAIVYAAALQEYIALIRSRPLALVMLAPPLEVSLARDAARTEKQVGHIWGHLDAIMREELPNTGLWVDNSGMNPDQTVDFILDGVVREGIVADDRIDPLKAR